MTVAADVLAERERALTSFLEGGQDELARACHAMARRFSRGGTLFACGTGAAASDAAHVAVEFMHPVIVGKRALPALAVTTTALVRGDDIAIGLDHGDGSTVAGFLAPARRQGALTIAMTAGGGTIEADHVLRVPSDDPYVVQEVQETAYHVLWELVHVFFEHPGLLAEACITCGDVAVEATVVGLAGTSATVTADGAQEDVAIDLVGDVRVGDRLLCHAGVALENLGPADDVSAQLYPFLDERESDLDAVLADVRASTVAKGRDTVALRRALDLDAVVSCGRALRRAADGGGRLIAFGNGGSATDAQDFAIDALALGLPAIALVDDPATITAVGNDVGFDNVFARQLIALGRAGDVALAISTSGSSPNIVAALEEAHRRGMVTCAITGYDGGRLAQAGWLDHLVAVGGDYVPRLQEAHATAYHLMLEATR
jgi:D-sedoheptulose 7-phosphate isomerase